MRKNTVKQALAEGKLQLGTGFGQLRSPEVAKILAAAGFRWAFIDTEHGGFDLETVQDICSTSLMVGLSPIVRVADLQYALIARALVWSGWIRASRRCPAPSSFLSTTRGLGSAARRSRPMSAAKTDA